MRQLFGLPQSLLTPLRLGGLYFMASRLNGSQGRFLASLEHAHSVLRLRNSSASPQEPEVTQSWVQLTDLEAATQGHAATTLWLLGYPDQALASLKQDLAYTATHPNLYLRASALTYATVFCFTANTREDAHEYLEAFMSLATEQILTSWLPYGQVCLGALQVDSGRAEGIGLIRQGLELFDAQGTVTHRPFLLSVYASAQQSLGQLGPAMKTFDEALAHAYKTGELGLEAELHRLKGELLIAMKDATEAEVLLRQAIAIATRQEAKSFELRALISLTSLMHQRGQAQSIKPMLENVYNWFTEGFETHDLREAKLLLGAF